MFWRTPCTEWGAASCAASHRPRHMWHRPGSCRDAEPSSFVPPSPCWCRHHLSCFHSSPPTTPRRTDASHGRRGRKEIAKWLDDIIWRRRKAGKSKTSQCQLWRKHLLGCHPASQRDPAIAVEQTGSERAWHTCLAETRCMNTLSRAIACPASRLF